MSTYEDQRFDKDLKKMTQTRVEYIECEVKKEIHTLRDFLDKDREELSETLKEIIGCVHVIKKGKYKGTICGKKDTKNNLCKKH